MISKYMSINISHTVKSLDNSIYIVEGESEPNGGFIVNEYSALNPAIETSVIAETKHIPHVENLMHFLNRLRFF